MVTGLVSGDEGGDADSVDDEHVDDDDDELFAETVGDTVGDTVHVCLTTLIVVVEFNCSVVPGSSTTLSVDTTPVVAVIVVSDDKPAAISNGVVVVGEVSVEFFVFIDFISESYSYKNLIASSVKRSNNTTSSLWRVCGNISIATALTGTNGLPCSAFDDGRVKSRKFFDAVFGEQET